MTREAKERNRYILARRKRGETLQSIGDHYNVTRERVRQILIAEKAKERVNNFVPSTRMRNVVIKATRAQLPNATLKERLRLFVSKYSVEAMANLPDCGAKTVAEIQRIADTLGEKPCANR